MMWPEFGLISMHAVPLVEHQSSCEAALLKQASRAVAVFVPGWQGRKAGRRLRSLGVQQRRRQSKPSQIGWTTLQPFPPQVQGLQSEYTRMVDSGAGAPSGPSAAAAGGGAKGAAGLSADEVATLRKLVADLEQQNSKLQVVYTIS